MPSDGVARGQSFSTSRAQPRAPPRRALTNWSLSSVAPSRGARFLQALGLRRVAPAQPRAPRRTDAAVCRASERWSEEQPWGGVRHKVRLVGKLALLHRRVGALSVGHTYCAPCFREAEWAALPYERGARLGAGAFAHVQRCRRDGEEYAMKVAYKRGAAAREKKEGVSRRAATVELTILARLGRHPTLVGLVDRFETSDAFVFILELATGGEVFERICTDGPYAEGAAAAVVRQLALGVRHLQAVGVCHRDIKPENLLHASAAPLAPVKLADFGLATLYGPRQPPMISAVGTPAYSAPELLEPGVEYGGEVDLWSVGVVLFVLLGGYNPFDPFGDAEPNEIRKRVRGCEWTFGAPLWQKVSAAAKDLLCKLLVAEPQRRATAADLLTHEWVSGAAGGGGGGAEESPRRVWREAAMAAALVTCAPASSRLAPRSLITTAVDEMRAVFDRYDLARSGSLSLSDVRAVLQAVIGKDEPPTLLAVEEVFKRVDSDANGMIEFDECQRVMAPLYDASQPALALVFSQLDTDSNGFIEAHELEAALRRLRLLDNESPEKAQLEASRAFAAADRGGQGRVSFDDFAVLFLGDAVVEQRSPPPMEKSPSRQLRRVHPE
ncbi:hypothetical protein AB1Y20_020908 [Prymnesium parvum]|uniref:Non-specific serine/threonine protein kinase n=1 Tax=Prymnesium parvum TaxID=97485 RepID=A0AB34JKJ2_PRYPA